MARVLSFDELVFKLKLSRDLISTLMAEIKNVERYINLQVKSGVEEYTSLITAIDAKIATMDYNRDDAVAQLGNITLALWDRSFGPSVNGSIGHSGVVVSATTSFIVTPSDIDLTGVYAVGDTIEITDAEISYHNGLWEISDFQGGFVFTLSTLPYETEDGFTISGITLSGTTATVTTAEPVVDLGLTTGRYVTHSGADQSAYNITAAITVTDTNKYTYTVSGSPATPATGSPLGRLVALGNANDQSMKIRLYDR